jgi:hypothetical protein
MTAGVVYRALARDENGDPIDADGNVVHDDNAPFGKIDVIIGGTSGSTRTTNQLAGLRGDVVSTDGMLGWSTNARVQLQDGDIVAVDGQRFKVFGPRLWGRNHGLTGRPARYQWIAATAN